ncbi:MAG: DUF5615 family PIN-like protein [Segetibacter sp.]
MSNNFPLIIADESTDAGITVALKQAGYETFSIQQIMPGTDDLDIIAMAATKKGFILTEDKYFGDELVFKKVSNNGAMLLRLAGVDIEEKIRLVLTAIEKHSEELRSAFSVLSKNKLRICKMG